MPKIIIIRYSDNRLLCYVICITYFYNEVIFNTLGRSVEQLLGAKNPIFTFSEETLLVIQSF